MDYISDLSSSFSSFTGSCATMTASISSPSPRFAPSSSSSSRVSSSSSRNEKFTECCLHAVRHALFSFEAESNMKKKSFTSVYHSTEGIPANVRLYYPALLGKFWGSRNLLIDALTHRPGTRFIPSLAKGGGEFAYLGARNQIMLKTLTRKEKRMFQKVIPDYVRHLTEHPHSLLPRFFVFASIRVQKKVKRIVLFANVFCESKNIHEVYDLKGSTANRNIDLSKGGAKLDNDFRETGKKIFLLKSARDFFLQTVRVDSMFLQSHNMMDYSLLVGLQHLSIEKEKKVEQKKEEEEREEDLDTDSGVEFGESFPFLRASKVGYWIAAGSFGPAVNEKKKKEKKKEKEVKEGQKMKKSENQKGKEANEGKKEEKKEEKIEKIEEKKKEEKGEVTEKNQTIQSAEKREIKKRKKRGKVSVVGAQEGVIVLEKEKEREKGNKREQKKEEEKGADIAEEKKSKKKKGRIDPGYIAESERESEKEGVDLIDEWDIGTQQEVKAAKESRQYEEEDFQTVFYFGIIDILESYNQYKKTAHFIKSFRHAPETLSTVPSGDYGKRFRSFAESITAVLEEADE